MNRHKLAVLVSSLFAVGFASAQAPPAPSLQKTPAPSQPDLSGNWTNATLTPTARPTAFGARAVYTTDEVAKIEKETARQTALGDSATDPNAPAPKSNSDVGGYNSGYPMQRRTIRRRR